LEELDGILREKSVSYDRIRPVLKYLQDHHLDIRKELSKKKYFDIISAKHEFTGQA